MAIWVGQCSRSQTLCFFSKHFTNGAISPNLFLVCLMELWGWGRYSYFSGNHQSNLDSSNLELLDAIMSSCNDTAEAETSTGNLACGKRCPDATLSKTRCIIDLV